MLSSCVALFRRVEGWLLPLGWHGCGRLLAWPVHTAARASAAAFGALCVVLVAVPSKLQAQGELLSQSPSQGPNQGLSQPLSFRLCTETQPALPLSNLDPQSPGPAQRYLAETARRTRARIEHITALWEECLNRLRLGEVDATNVTGYAGVNIELGAFPMQGSQPDSQRAIGVIPTHLYRRVGSAANYVDGRFHEVKTAVGVLAGFQVNSIAVAQAGGTPDDDSQTVEALARRLAAGRLDMVAADENLQRLIDRQYVGKLERLPTPLRMDHYYVAFRKAFYHQHRDAVEQFWTVLGQVRREQQAVQSR